MKPIFYACMITVLVLSACSSGKSTFERGDYYEAVITSVNRLRRNSDHKKSVETLRQAYPMAVRFYEDRANTAIASAEPFKWTGVVDSYTRINYLYDEIRRCPGALRVIPNPVNYFTRLQEARQNAAEEHYAAGIVALQFNEREKAKQAYRYFKTANEFVPGYKEVIGYMEAALSAATVKILVEPIPVHSKSVGVSADFFNDKISEFVHSAPISEFVKFYSRVEAEKLKLDPDHIIQLSFDEFTVGQVYKHEKEIHLTKDSVVMATYVTPSTASHPNAGTPESNSSSRTGFVASGTGVLASTQQPATPNANTNVSTNSGANAQANTTAAEQAEKERVAREAAAKRQAEVEKALADKLRADKEAAEKERIAREAIEKTAAEKALAEKERLAKEQAERELAAKLEAEKNVQEAAAQAAEKARAEAAEKARLEAAGKARLEMEKAEREKAERERLEKERAAKAAAEAVVADAKAERERAEKAAAEKAKVEKEKAEKEKAEKEKAEKEKVEKAKYVDPTIKSSDTTNVKDPVTICHVPPGNNAKRRTLVISRAALKAHLGHGDIQGDCEADKKNPDSNPKEKPAKDEKAKPQGGKSGNGPGARNGSGGNNDALASGTVQEPIFFASANIDPAHFFRYLAPDAVEADTNKVYGTVNATLYQYSKTTTAKGVVSFRIIDAKTGALLTVEKMPGEFVWVSEWATFNGDERALSAEQLRLTHLKEQPAPPAQELFIEFTRPIYEQITTRIREFYEGY